MARDYGFSPFEEDALMMALRTGGFSGAASLRKVAQDRLAYSSAPPPQENTDTSSKPGGKSLLGKIGSFVSSDPFRAAVAGLAAPIQGGDPLGNFARAATVSLGTKEILKKRRTDAEIQSAEEARKARAEGRDIDRLNLEGRRVTEYESRGGAGAGTPADTAAKRNYDDLIKMGVPEDEALDRAYGNLPRDPVVPQGEEDVTAIAAHYGVSPETARVMKTSGATRIRPRQTTVTEPDPYTGEMKTKVITVNEPIQLKTERELNRIIDTASPDVLQKIAAGDMPDEVPDDIELQARLQARAASMLQSQQNQRTGQYLGQGRPASER